MIILDHTRSSFRRGSAAILGASMPGSGYAVTTSVHANSSSSSGQDTAVVARAKVRAITQRMENQFDHVKKGMSQSDTTAMLAYCALHLARDIVYSVTLG